MVSSFARGQFNVDYGARPDLAQLRADRVERVQRILRASSIAALLVWKDENVRYLTSHRPQILTGKSALLNGCLLLPDRTPILLSSGGDLERARRTMPWISEFHAIPIMEARGLIAGVVDSTLAPLLRSVGLDTGRLGIDECAVAQMLELGRALPNLTLDDGDAVMQQARRVKFPAEIALMEEAAAIAEGVTQAAFDAIAPGVRENEVAGEAMRMLYRLGGEVAHVATPFVASGEHMSPPHRLTTDKVIREGDLVFIDIGAMWNGYFGDLGRTTICGRPSRRQQEIYTAVYEALRDATAASKAGNTNGDVAEVVTAAAERHGLAGSFISLFIGHGIGIGSNEPPYIGETLPGAETVTLEAGMTFAVEPLIWVDGIRGGGGVRLEDTIVVETDAGRALTRTAFDERLLV
jgi:Xaa-Pro aminopeptidase